MIEIVTRSVDATDTEPRRIAARNKTTGVKIEMPYPGNLEGREAHESIATLILADGERLSWDRDTASGYVFVIIGG